ncbi:MAG: poly-gamma-glutamate biosynthesis protein PgsC [Candidatus Delongbacteria bacterium]|nr:poly-gamma-glutamate biosynthesis protein PgsC [Candidatus Delongbacteria bacterium]MBN2834736.1 poly-gamma-glutamate biosynthesis protein PgsC [Candidatus Delongbacteria bacterium]
MAEVSIGIGVIISLFLLETFGAAAGGIVVAGYVALFTHQPYSAIGTLIISILVFLIVKVIGNYMFLYGRRRMVISVLLGFIFGWTVRNYGLFTMFHADYTVTVIGFIIPGLIANSMAKQGFFKTITVLGIATVVTRLILILVFEGKMINIG